MAKLILSSDGQTIKEYELDQEILTIVESRVMISILIISLSVAPTPRFLPSSMILLSKIWAAQMAP